MIIDRYEMGAVTILRLDGNIDGPDVDDLRLALAHCIKDERCNVVINMTNVKFTSYLGVGVLVERVRQLRAYNGDLKLCNVNTYTQRLFRMSAVTKVFATFASEPEAIQAFRKAA
jgi:anti-sigma B factor antagonist